MTSARRDNIFVLNRIIFGESDLIVRGLNQQGALISFIAKGALKSRKRFAGGVLEPGHVIGVEYQGSRRSSLHHLRQAWFLKRFEEIRQDYHRLELAFYFLSLIDKIAQEEMDNPEMFHLLGNSLEATCRSQNLAVLRVVFEFRLLWIQGVLPKELHQEIHFLTNTVTEHENLPRMITPASWKHTASIVHSAIIQYAEPRNTYSPPPSSRR